MWAAIVRRNNGQSFYRIRFLFEKIRKHLNVFIHAENFTDRRQTRWDKIYKNTITNTTFRDIYIPVEDFVLNGGLKIKF